MRRHTLGSLMIFACALSWGLIGIIVRELDAPALVIVFYRVALSAVAIAGVTLLMGRRDRLRAPRRSVFALGVLLGLHWTCYFLAIKHTSVASAVLITYAGPLLMALIAPVLIHERVAPVSIAALLVALSGIALITLSGGSGAEAVQPVGVAFALLAALTFAFQVVLLKKLVADVDPVTVQLYESVAAAVVLLPVGVFAPYSFHGRDLAYLLVLGVLLTGLTGILYIGALRWVAATTAGVLGYMEPVSAALLAALLLGQRLTPTVIVGGGAIVAAGVVVALRAPHPLSSLEEPPLAPHPGDAPVQSPL